MIEKVSRDFDWYGSWIERIQPLRSFYTGENQRALNGTGLPLHFTSLFIFVSARNLAAPPVLHLPSPCAGMPHAPRVLCCQFLASLRDLLFCSSICSWRVKIRFLWESLVEAPPAGKCLRFAERIWIVLCHFSHEKLCSTLFLSLSLCVLPIAESPCLRD